MSHFSVIVTKTNRVDVDAQLERFCEITDGWSEYTDFTPIVDFGGESTYIEDVLEQKKDFFNRIKDLDPERAKRVEEEIKRVEKTLLGTDEDILDYMLERGFERTEEGYGYYENPDAEYDYYRIGGGWSNFFIPLAEYQSKYTEDVGCDEIKVRHVDWSATVEHQKSKFIEAFKNSPVTDLNGKDLRAEDVTNPLVFAVLHDDEWIQLSDNDMLKKIVSTLDPDDELTIVDCHI